MVFSDLFFLYIFIPAVMLCYALARCADSAYVKSMGSGHYSAPANTMPYSNAVLIIFSLIFYAWGEPTYIALMIISIIINYIAGLCIDRGRRKSKAALIVGIVINIGLIGVFKYANLIMETLGFMGLPVESPGIAFRSASAFTRFRRSLILWTSTAERFVRKEASRRCCFTFQCSRSLSPDLSCATPPLPRK